MIRLARVAWMDRIVCDTGYEHNGVVLPLWFPVGTSSQEQQTTWNGNNNVLSHVFINIKACHLPASASRPIRRGRHCKFIQQKDSVCPDYATCIYGEGWSPRMVDSCRSDRTAQLLNLGNTLHRLCAVKSQQTAICHWNCHRQTAETSK